MALEDADLADRALPRAPDLEQDFAAELIENGNRVGAALSRPDRSVVILGTDQALGEELQAIGAVGLEVI